jgi:hypothetical protein
MTNDRPTLPADATDAEREAFAAANRASYLARKAEREQEKADRLLSMLRDLDAAYDRPVVR